MEIEILSSFVFCFVRRERRERLLYEIDAPKKRDKFFDRFAHDTQRFFNRDMIVLQGNRLKSNQILKMIYENGKIPDKFFLIVDNQAYESENGKELLERAFDNLGQSVLLCDHFAFIKEETEYGAPEKILLKNSKFLVR